MRNLSLLLITIIYLSLMVIFWQTVSADGSYVFGQRELKTSNFEGAIEQANKSIEKNPDEPRYYYGRTKILLTMTAGLEDVGRVSLKKLALNDLQTAQNLNPNNLVTLRNIVPLYYFLAIGDLEKVADEKNVDPEFIAVTKGYFDMMHNYSTTDVGIYTLLAKYEKRLGLNELYEQSVESIKRLRPDLLEWYLE